jgi:peptide deformylase
MALLDILKVPDPVLRERSRPVTRITETTRRLIDDMIETMHAAPGVGLAAPQVGILQRIFVYDIGDGPDALINPEIVAASGEEVSTEACLSIPRLEGDVRRALAIEVSGLNRRGKPVRLRADELLARVFQHEIDHLDGVLFTDRAEPDSLHWVTDEEIEERRRKRRRRPRRDEECESAATPG